MVCIYCISYTVNIEVCNNGLFFMYIIQEELGPLDKSTVNNALFFHLLVRANDIKGPVFSIQYWVNVLIV